MPRFSENMNLYRLDKMVGHGYYVYPFIRKTVLESIQFFHDRKVMLRFYNKHMNLHASTGMMSFEEANEFIKRHFFKNSFGLLEEIMKNAASCDDVRESMRVDLDGMCVDGQNAISYSANGIVYVRQCMNKLSKRI